MTPADLLENWLRRSRLSTGVLVGIALVLGCGATGINTYIQYREITAHHQVRFQSQANVALEQAGERIQGDIGLLHGMVALYDASTSVEREDFRAYALAMDLERNFPGVTAVGFLPHMEPPELTALTVTAAREGIPGYEVRSWSGGKREGPYHAPVWYVEPFSGDNIRLLGRDFMTDPVLAEALELAGRSGLPAMSGPVRLAGERNESQPPIVMLVSPFTGNSSCISPRPSVGRPYWDMPSWP